MLVEALALNGSEFDTPWRGLTRYVGLVAEAIGIPPSACNCAPDLVGNAYIAVDGRMPRYPDRDVALLWDEENGWSAGIETGCGEDVIVLAYLGGEVVPPPATVADFLAELLADGYPGEPVPPGLRRVDDADGLERKLSAYARPASVLR